MARAATTSRWAKTADRSTRSPFRSERDHVRYLAAARMIAKRSRELTVLERALDSAADDISRKRAQVRISATKMSIRSWEAYLAAAAPIEPRATLAP